MKYKALFLLLGTAFCSIGHAMTPGQCAKAIETNHTTIELLVITISMNELASQFLLQDGCYGVWGSRWQGIRLRRKHLDAGPICDEFVHNWFLPTIVFGYSLQNNANIPSWLGFPDSRLDCQKIEINGFEPLDICCLCDKKDSRKRKISFDPPHQGIKRPLYDHLIDLPSMMDWQHSP